MLRWIAGLLTLVVLAGAYFSFTQHNDLLAARGELLAVQFQAADAERAAEAAQALARKYARQAEATQVKLAIANKHADVAIVQAPDTCDTYIAAVAGARDLAVETAEAWRKSYVSEQQATARLTKVVRDYGNASTNILKASRPSFLQRLIPKPGFSVTAGVSPITRRADVIVGPSLNWTF